MKFFAFLMAAILILSFSVTAFADEILDPSLPDPVPEIETEFSQPENEYLNMVLNGMQNNLDDLNERIEVIEDDIDTLSESSTLPDSSAPDSSPEEITEINPDTDMPVDIELYSVSPIQPEDTSGLKAILLSILGDYDPVIVEYKYQNSNQTSFNYLREVLPDYPWCASFFIFALLIYCTFRIGGALLHG